MMGCKLVIFLTVVTLVVAFVLETLIKFNFFTEIHDHFPGKCNKFIMNGSEDMALFPNDHVLISSGLEIFGNSPHPPANIFMVDLTDSSPQPIKLSIDEEFLTKSPDFNPHGVSHWVTPAGELLFYVVNHAEKCDFIESFIYHPDTKALEYRKSFSDPELYNVNDILLVDTDVFYATKDLYYKDLHVKKLEAFSRVHFGSVLFVDGRGDEVKVQLALDKLWYTNGIARSNDGRFIYVNECGAGTVTACTVNEDNTLTKLKAIHLHGPPDNTFVSPVNGHLFMGMISKTFEFIEYSTHSDPENSPAGSRVLHVAFDESAENPFEDYQVEEVFSTSGKMISATSVGVYHNKKLLVGSIRTGMMVCDAPYLIYT